MDRIGCDAMEKNRGSPLEVLGTSTLSVLQRHFRGSMLRLGCVGGKKGDKISVAIAFDWPH